MIEKADYQKSDEWCGMIHIMEEHHFTYEKKDRDYYAFAEYHYYYEKPELTDGNITDFIQFTIFGNNTRIKIKSVDFNWIERFLEKNYPKLYCEKLYCDVILRYYKGETELLLFSYKGYSEPWIVEERASIEELFDKLYESDYAPCQSSFRHNETVPFLKINKQEDGNNYYSYIRYKQWRENIDKFGPNYLMNPNKSTDVGGPTTDYLYDELTFESSEPMYIKYQKHLGTSGDNLPF